MSNLITYVSMTISLEEVSLYGWYDLFDWLQLYQNLLLIFMKFLNQNQSNWRPGADVIDTY